MRCNFVHPGSVLSGMADTPRAYDMHAGHPDGTRDDLIKAGRSYGILRGSTFMPPEVIANAGVFLNSDLASNMTGDVLPSISGTCSFPA